MPLEVAQAAISRHLEQADSFDEVEISLHGGEPFLEFDALRKLCEWVWSRSWRKPCVFFATTNGTRVHGPIQDWLMAHKGQIWLGLSLDGTPEMHNTNRSGSFSEIDLEFFRQTWPSQPAKMTISDVTLPYLAEGIRFLHSLGLEFHCNFACGVDWSKSAYSDLLGGQLEALVRYYLKNPQIAPCDFMAMPLRFVSSLACDPSSVCPEVGTGRLQKWCGAGTHMVAVDVDGREYPCHMFLPNAAGGRSNSLDQFDFTNLRSLQDPRCEACALLPICPTCYGSNYIERGHPSLRDPGVCTLTKIRALACSSLQAQMIVQRGEYPAFGEMSSSDLVATIRGIEKVQAELRL